MIKIKEFKTSDTIFMVIIIFGLILFAYIQQSYFPVQNKNTEKILNEFNLIQKQLSIQPISSPNISYRNRIEHNSTLLTVMYDKKNKTILLEEIQKIALNNGYIIHIPPIYSHSLLEMISKDNLSKSIVIEANEGGNLFLVLQEID